MRSQFHVFRNSTFILPPSRTILCKNRHGHHDSVPLVSLQPRRWLFSSVTAPSPRVLLPPLAAHGVRLVVDSSAVDDLFTVGAGRLPAVVVCHLRTQSRWPEIRIFSNICWRLMVAGSRHRQVVKSGDPGLFLHVESADLLLFSPGSREASLSIALLRRLCMFCKRKSCWRDRQTDSLQFLTASLHSDVSMCSITPILVTPTCL